LYILQFDKEKNVFKDKSGERVGLTIMSGEYEFTNESAPASKSTYTKPLPSDVPIVVEPIRKRDLQPTYANELAVPDNGWYGSLINGIGSCIGSMGAIPCCVCCPNPFKSVNQGEVGLVTRFGQFYKSVDPGLVRINPLSEKLHYVEVRIQVLDVPHQVCMTKDNVNIRLSSVLYYHIVSPHKSKFGVTNVIQALMERTQTTLRHVVGARVLQEIIERREEVAASIQEIIEETATSWGVKVESILIKDILLSEELQESLSQAAKSKRAGESKIITAKAEVESAKLMRRAADILASKAAMQIRYLEAMQQMARSANSKVIFMPSQDAIEHMSSNAVNPNFQAALEGSDTQRMTENMAYNEMSGTL
jgi:erythrocyte band 7 integral membrane protein